MQASTSNLNFKNEFSLIHVSRLYYLTFLSLSPIPFLPSSEFLVFLRPASFTLCLLYPCLSSSKSFTGSSCSTSPPTTILSVCLCFPLYFSSFWSIFFPLTLYFCMSLYLLVGGVSTVHFQLFCVLAYFCFSLSPNIFLCRLHLAL